MPMKEKGVTLLDDLCQAVSGDFLSNLREEKFRAPLHAQLCRTAVEQYSTAAWCEAAAYLTGKECYADTAEQAKQYIMDWLK